MSVRVVGVMNRILIASVLISLIVGIGGGYAVSLGRISELQYEAMSLESEVSTLTSDYDDLNVTYNELLGDYSDLNAAYSNLTIEYDKLQSILFSLNENYTQLETAYEELEKAYELLNAAGLVFDGLRISDLKVVNYWYFDVVGNVTNVSNQSMSKVYVVLFTYETDGSLDYYYVETIENLAVNETNTFSFWSVLDHEDQKFKVLAVGSYGLADIESDEVVRLLALLEEAKTRIAQLEQMVNYEVYVLTNNNYYYSIKSDLENANETILVAMYSMIYDPDDPFDWANDLITELVYAKERGVNVTVIIEYRTYWDHMDRNLEAYDYLLAQNVSVRLDYEADTDHMKLVIIDDNIVYIGSHNWSESGLYYNHETSVKIVSEDIAEVFKAYFETI
jgi:hypothetical protein